MNLGNSPYVVATSNFLAGYLANSPFVYRQDQQISACLPPRFEFRTLHMTRSVLNLLDWKRITYFDLPPQTPHQGQIQLHNRGFCSIKWSPNSLCYEFGDRQSCKGPLCFMRARRTCVPVCENVSPDRVHRLVPRFD
jgi:hypothetical protein